MAKKAKAKAAKKKKTAVKQTKAKKAAAKKAAAKPAKKAKAVKKAKKAKKAKTAVQADFRPPYKCERTLEPGVCLKFFLNPASGDYDLGGDEVPCSTCQYFM